MKSKKSQKEQKGWPPDSPNFILCESIQERHKDEPSGFLEFLKEFKKKKRNTYSMMLVTLRSDRVFGRYLLELVLNFLPKDQSKGYGEPYLEWIEGSQRMMKKAKDSLKDWSSIRRLRKKLEEMLEEISPEKQAASRDSLRLERTSILEKRPNQDFVGKEEHRPLTEFDPSIYKYGDERDSVQFFQTVDYVAKPQECQLSLILSLKGCAIKSTNQDTTDVGDCTVMVKSLDISRLRCDEGRNPSPQRYVNARGMPSRMATNEDTTDLPYVSPSGVNLLSFQAMQKTSVQNEKRNNNSSLRSSLNLEEKPRTEVMNSSRRALPYEALNSALNARNLYFDNDHSSIQRPDRQNRDYISQLNGLTTGLGFNSNRETNSHERRILASNVFIKDANNDKLIWKMYEIADGFISY